MELQINKQPVAINETILNTTLEQPVELDIVLPDYCPDIVRILKCSGSPAVTNAYVSGDKLIIEGVVVATVYYKSPEKELCCTETKTNFQKTVDLKTTPENPVVNIQPQMGYLNCRAVNQRRIEMRGAVNLPVNVTSVKQEEVVTSAEGLGVQLRPIWIEVDKLVANEKKNFTVKEDVELGFGKPGASSVLRASAIPTLSDQKVLAGKVILKGDVTLEILYRAQNEESSLETASFNLPISTIIDVPGVNEDSNCSISLSMGTLEVIPKQDIDGQADVLSVEGSVVADVVAGQKDTCTMSVDCYGTKYNTQSKSKTLSFLKMLDPVKEKITVKEMMEYPPGCSNITDLWVELDSYGSKIENDQLVFSGKVLVEMFADDDEGEIELFEKALPFEHKVTLGQNCELTDTLMNFCLSAVSYSLSDGHIDFKCEILVTGVLLCEHRQKVITDIDVDVTRPARTDKSSSLNVYFADKGESIWEIAKRYNTSPDLIMQENNITDDVVTARCMLLIPVL